MASSLSFTRNSAAILTAGIIAVGSGALSGILYQPRIPDEPAYRIQVAEVEEADTAEPEVVALPVLLAAADAGSGEAVANKCTSCHDFAQGGANKIGPALWDVVGRNIASVADFSYSDVLAGMEGDWSYENLDAFIANPKGWAPGTKMAFAGISNEEDRADLLVYMQSLAEQPVPLPEPEAAGAEEEADSDEAALDARSNGDDVAARATPDGGAADEKAEAASGIVYLRSISENAPPLPKS